MHNSHRNPKQFCLRTTSVCEFHDYDVFQQVPCKLIAKEHDKTYRELPIYKFYTKAFKAKISYTMFMHMLRTDVVSMVRWMIRKQWFRKCVTIQPQKLYTFISANGYVPQLSLNQVDHVEPSRSMKIIAKHWLKYFRLVLPDDVLSGYTIFSQPITLQYGSGSSSSSEDTFITYEESAEDDDDTSWMPDMGIPNPFTMARDYVKGVEENVAGTIGDSVRDQVTLCFNDMIQKIKSYFVGMKDRISNTCLSMDGVIDLISGIWNWILDVLLGIRSSFDDLEISWKMVMASLAVVVIATIAKCSKYISSVLYYQFLDWTGYTPDKIKPQSESMSKLYLRFLQVTRILSKEQYIYLRDALTYAPSLVDFLRTVYNAIVRFFGKEDWAVKTEQSEALDHVVMATSYLGDTEATIKTCSTNVVEYLQFRKTYAYFLQAKYVHKHVKLILQRKCEMIKRSLSVLDSSITKPLEAPMRPLAVALLGPSSIGKTSVVTRILDFIAYQVLKSHGKVDGALTEALCFTGSDDGTSSGFDSTYNDQPFHHMDDVFKTRTELELAAETNNIISCINDEPKVMNKAGVMDKGKCIYQCQTITMTSNMVVQDWKNKLPCDETALYSRVITMDVMYNDKYMFTAKEMAMIKAYKITASIMKKFYKMYKFKLYNYRGFKETHKMATFCKFPGNSTSSFITNTYDVDCEDFVKGYALYLTEKLRRHDLSDVMLEDDTIHLFDPLSDWDIPKSVKGKGKTQDDTIYYSGEESDEDAASINAQSATHDSEFQGSYAFKAGPMVFYDPKLQISPNVTGETVQEILKSQLHEFYKDRRFRMLLQCIAYDYNKQVFIDDTHMDKVMDALWETYSDVGFFIGFAKMYATYKQDRTLNLVQPVKEYIFSYIIRESIQEFDIKLVTTREYLKLRCRILELHGDNILYPESTTNISWLKLAIMGSAMSVLTYYIVDMFTGSDPEPVKAQSAKVEDPVPSKPPPNATVAKWIRLQSSEEERKQLSSLMHKVSAQTHLVRFNAPRKSYHVRAINIFDHVWVTVAHVFLIDDLKSVDVIHSSWDLSARCTPISIKDVEILYQNNERETCVFKLINKSYAHRGSNLIKYFPEKPRCVETTYGEGTSILVNNEVGGKPMQFKTTVKSWPKPMPVEGHDHCFEGNCFLYNYPGKDSYCGFLYITYDKMPLIESMHFGALGTESLGVEILRPFLSKLYDTHKFDMKSYGLYVPTSKLDKIVLQCMEGVLPTPTENVLPFQPVGISSKVSRLSVGNGILKSPLQQHLPWQPSKSPVYRKTQFWVNEEVKTYGVTSPLDKTKAAFRRSNCPSIPSSHIAMFDTSDPRLTAGMYDSQDYQPQHEWYATKEEIIKGSTDVNAFNTSSSAAAMRTYYDKPNRKGFVDTDAGSIIDPDFDSCVSQQKAAAYKGCLVSQPHELDYKLETLPESSVNPPGYQKVTRQRYMEVKDDKEFIEEKDLLSKCRLFCKVSPVTHFNMMREKGKFNSYTSRIMVDSPVIAYNPHGFVSNLLHEKLKGGDNVMINDLKGQDITLDPMTLLMQAHLDSQQMGIELWSKEYIRYMTICSSSWNSYVQFKDVIYKPIVFNASGGYDTINNNCLTLRQQINAILAYLIPNITLKELQAMQIVITGDDHIIIVPDKYAHVITPYIYSQFMLYGYGMVVTDSNKKLYTPDSNFHVGPLNHVSRTWVMNEDLGKVMHALDKSTIEAIPCWITKKIPMQEAVTQNSRAAILEAFKWGRDYFNYLRDELLRAAALKHIKLNLPNYQFFLDHHMITFNKDIHCEVDLIPTVDSIINYDSDSYEIALY